MSEGNNNWKDLARSFYDDTSACSFARAQDKARNVMAAKINELLATRQNQTPPSWTKEIGALNEPFYLLRSAETMKRLRVLCETQSPEPMRKRQLYAPPNFLEFA